MRQLRNKYFIWKLNMKQTEAFFCLLDSSDKCHELTIFHFFTSWNKLVEHVTLVVFEVIY